VYEDDKEKKNICNFLLAHKIMELRELWSRMRVKF
jgi:hypothetical protein